MNLITDFYAFLLAAEYFRDLWVIDRDDQAF